MRRFFIVNNTESGLDVDKLEYYRRDVFNTGVSMQSNYQQLLDSSKVVKCTDNRRRICYPEKYAKDVLDCFKTRFDMHQTVQFGVWCAHVSDRPRSLLVLKRRALVPHFVCSAWC